MSYKLRNSVALGILLFLILAVGTYIRAFNQPRAARQIQASIKKIDTELQNTPNLVNQFNDLSASGSYSFALFRYVTVNFSWVWILKRESLPSGFSVPDIFSASAGFAPKSMRAPARENLRKDLLSDGK